MDKIKKVLNMKQQLTVWLLAAFLCSISAFQIKADEGMWLPVLIKQLNIEDMRAKGFRLSAEDIYSVNQACLKDAVMVFGGGCTAEMISKEGLILTNHHCGFGQIQSHSTVENDYLKDGFWAMSREEELMNEGLKVTFLKGMQEVSKEVLAGWRADMNKEETEALLKKNKEQVLKKYEKEPWQARIVSFFHDNVYYLLYEQVFEDVRLVGAPPSAIGKFGGDTDNWMWPRHGGDFSLFRIYADKENKPAKPSRENIPFRAEKALSISLKGVQEGDFTFVLGYPGRTSEYHPYLHLKMLTQDVYPSLIDIRGAKLDVINKGMESSPKVRIQYAAKAASISNSWKRWIGEIRGLKKLDALNKKQQFERGFDAWAKGKGKYEHVLKGYEDLYPQFTRLYLVKNVYNELLGRNGMEFVNFTHTLHRNVKRVLEGKQEWTEVQKMVDKFYKDYDSTVDAELTATLLKQLKKQLTSEEISKSVYSEPEHKLVQKIYNTPMAQSTGGDYIAEFKDSPDKLLKRLEKLYAYQLRKDMLAFLIDENIEDRFAELNDKITSLHKDFMAGQMEYMPDHKFYPDANFTFRMTYGKVAGYEARNGVYYEHTTTLDGVIEKDNPEIYDYQVPPKVKKLYATKDFGDYANEEGRLPVCFIATNHTTGGNSGSPVLNADGELIGLNFDRAWEGVMSDLMYNPEQCRNISVDIRYILFVVDKLGGAGYLLEEMDIVK